MTKFAIVGLAFGVASAAWGFGGGAPIVATYPTYYYAPAVRYYYAPVSCCTVVPMTYVVPAAAVAPACPPNPCPRYATTTPAPPSGTPTATTQEPPISTRPTPKGPSISHSRSVGGLTQTPETRQTQCRVSFWNLTEYNLTLTVGGTPHALAKDRAVVLTVDRNFVWQTNYHTPKTEAVPDDVNHFEVLVK